MNQYLEKYHIRSHIVCDKPHKLHARVLNHIDKKDLNCNEDGNERIRMLEICYFSKLFSCLDSIGKSTKLKLSNGSDMFICHTEGSLNLDEFETEIESESDEIPLRNLDIHNLASNFIGTHECLFDQLPYGLNDRNLKLIVTTAANLYKQDTEDTEFKAELIVEYPIQPNTFVTDDIHIQCSKSGKFNVTILNVFVLSFEI